MTVVKLDIRDVLKQAMVQLKYEEMGAWLNSHGISLLYSHENGFTVVDKKYLEENPKLKKELDKMIKDIQKKIANSAVQKGPSEVEYIG